MDADSTNDKRRIAASRRFSFGVSNLMLLVAIVAISIAWWVDHNRSAPSKYDVSGPVVVSYKVRSSPTTTVGGPIVGVRGINFRGETIVIYTANGGTVFLVNRLIEFSWEPE